MDESSEPPHGDGTRVDVVRYPAGGVKAVPAGKGAAIVRSQNEVQPGSVLRDRVVQGAGAVAVAFAALSTTLALGYSVLVLRSVLLGMLVAVVVAAMVALGFGVVVAVRWTRAGDAELFDEGVTLRDAREQWDATPVAEVASSGDRQREREHASEGSVR